ncbi:MAG: YqiA/YcfP family alpha/beta fold hydrolase [Verrucomicrobiota bacterium]
MRTLYLHGFGSSPESQKARFFQTRFAERGLTLELPNLVPGELANTTLTEQLSIVNALTGRDRVLLIGSSLGGFIAALHAARNDRVERLVLLAPAFGFPGRWKEKLGPEAIAQWKESDAHTVFNHAANCECSMRYQFLTDAEGYEEEPAITQPTLILHGIEDDVVPCSYSERFEAGRANVKLRKLATDHRFTESEDETWQQVERFIF